MVSRHAPNALAAYFAGSCIGLLPLLADGLLGAGEIGPGALVGFSALGGAAVTLGYVALGWLVRPDAALSGALLVGLAFVAAQLALLLNVVILPEQGLLHPASALLTLAAVAPVAAAGWGASRLKLGAWISSRERPLGVLGAIVLAACSLQVAQAWTVESTASPSALGDGPKLLLIVMDAVRHDHVDSYGYEVGASPNLDRWADVARVYEAAFSASSHTRYSVPVMLRGARGGRPRDVGLPGSVHQHGNTSGCFSGTPILERGSEMTRSFHHIAGSTWSGFGAAQRLFGGTFVGTFVLRWPLLAPLWDDRRLVDEALAWAEAVEGPVFLYVHLMDAHAPYDNGAIDGRSWRARRILSPRSGMAMTDAEREDVRAHDAGGVLSVDRQVGRILERAGAWGRPFLAVITADHGESLGEAGRWVHGDTLAPVLVESPCSSSARESTPGGSPLLWGMFRSCRRSWRLLGSRATTVPGSTSGLPAATRSSRARCRRTCSIEYRAATGWSWIGAAASNGSTSSPWILSNSRTCRGIGQSSSRGSREDWVGSAQHICPLATSKDSERWAIWARSVLTIGG